MCILNLLSAQAYNFCSYPCYRRPYNQISTVPDHDQNAYIIAGQHQQHPEHLNTTTGKASHISRTGSCSIRVSHTACRRRLETGIKNCLPITGPGKANANKTQGTRKA